MSLSLGSQIVRTILRAVITRLVGWASVERKILTRSEASSQEYIYSLQSGRRNLLIAKDQLTSNVGKVKACITITGDNDPQQVAASAGNKLIESLDPRND